MKRKQQRTTKTVSIDSDLADWAERQAASENRPFSNFVETVLKKVKSEEEAREPAPQAAA